jgi:hypothetical protein
MWSPWRRKPFPVWTAFKSGKNVEKNSKWFRSLLVQMHLGLKTDPCCPILLYQIMAALVFHRSSRFPPDLHP